MAAIIQRLARQALLTFSGPPRPGFPESLGKLKGLMAEVRAEDLKLVPRTADSWPAGASPRPEAGASPRPEAGASPRPAAPPVTYMSICETGRFSMGVFLLRPGASIPLHDHPGMHGLLRVLYGTARISCFDRSERPSPAAHRGALLRSVLRSTGDYTENSGPCVISPDRDNLHQIDAVDGPTAFLDILAPPYDPDAGRDCRYYRVLTGPEVKHTEQEQEQEVWLLEVSQPRDFRCGGEPYPGPEVRL